MTVDSGPFLPRVTCQASIFPCCAPKQQLYAPQSFSHLHIDFNPLLPTCSLYPHGHPGTQSAKGSALLLYREGICPRSHEKAPLCPFLFDLGLW